MILAHRSWGDPSDRVALLVHGGGDSSTTWNRFGPWLASRGWHVIAVDLRGHGDSRVDATADPSVSAFAEDLFETITVLRPGAQGVDLLIGASRGTVVILACLAARPSFTRRLVLLDPPGVGESIDVLRLLAETEEGLLEDPAAHVRKFFEEAEERPTDEEIAAIVASLNACDKAFNRAYIEGIANIDMVALAEQCLVPTLLLLGRDKDTPLGHDTTIAKDTARYSCLLGNQRERFCAALRYGRVHSLECGHAIHMLPSTAGVYAEFLDLLSAWLAETEAALEVPAGVP